jgi:hypothetical protein
MQNRHDGPLLKNRREKPKITTQQMVNGLISVMSPEAKMRIGIEEKPKKPRKLRAKETRPRKQPERELRNAVIKELRRHGIKVIRVENSITGKNNTGVADLIVFNLHKGLFAFVELKAEQGRLTGRQPEFQEACRICGINYWVVRSVREAVEIVC